MYLSEEPCLQSDIRNDLPLSIWIDIGRLRRIIIIYDFHLNYL